MLERTITTCAYSAHDSAALRAAAVTRGRFWNKVSVDSRLGLEVQALSLSSEASETGGNLVWKSEWSFSLAGIFLIVVPAPQVSERCEPRYRPSYHPRLHHGRHNSPEIAQIPE